MPLRRRGRHSLPRLAAPVILCALALSILTLSHVHRPQGAPAEVDAVNWELVDRVLSRAPPRDASFRSQFGQDEWVARMHPEPGFYLDLGANSATALSNTFALDRRRWRGVAVDPFPTGFDDLAANRTCAVLRSAVSHNDGVEVQFVLPALNTAIGGILETLDMHREAALGANGTRIVRLRTLGIRELLVGRAPSVQGKPPLPSIPRHVDYLSLDVEGQEAEILEAWPFERNSIGLITVEHNYEEPKRHRIREVLQRNGFVYAHHVDVDDWYVNESVYFNVTTSEPLQRHGAAGAAPQLASVLRSSSRRLILILNYGSMWGSLTLALVLAFAVGLRRRWRPQGRL